MSGSLWSDVLSYKKGLAALKKPLCLLLSQVEGGQGKRDLFWKSKKAAGKTLQKHLNIFGVFWTRNSIIVGFAWTPDFLPDTESVCERDVWARYSDCLAILIFSFLSSQFSLNDCGCLHVHNSNLEEKSVSLAQFFCKKAGSQGLERPFWVWKKWEMFLPSHRREIQKRLMQL